MHAPPNANGTAPVRAPSPTRMQHLREATRVAHARIELALPLLDPSLTKATYIGVLRAFHGFYAPLEPRLARAAGAHGVAIALDERWKTGLLRADLRALGETSAAIDALPSCAALPRVTSTSHALGVLYVVEGATLGGRIIGRHLRDGLGLNASTGASFFAGYGEQTGAMWTRLTAHVDAAPFVDTEEAASAAVETFETLLAWFSTALSSA